MARVNTNGDHALSSNERALLVYLLPRKSWEDVLQLQQRLVFDMGDEPRRKAGLILVEHPPVITVGRQGSYRHIRMDDSAVTSGQIPVRWTNRGGDCWLQQPGQLAAYPILPLSHVGDSVQVFRQKLYQTIEDVLSEHGLRGTSDPTGSAVLVGGRRIASVGVAIKNWVTYHGCSLNVCVPLDDQPMVRAEPDNRYGWTCMFRELRTPVRVEGVRESFLRHFAANFGYSTYDLSGPPPGSLPVKRRAHANANLADH